MKKKTKRVIRAKKKNPEKKRFPFELSFFILLGVIIYAVFFRKTSAPYVDERAEISAVPPEVSQVLGKQTKRNASPEVTLHIPILLYHYVEFVKDKGDTIRQSLNILPPVLEQQIKTLKDAGYQFVTPYEISRAMDSKEVLSPKSVVLTFDDGYEDFYTDVLPILKKYNVRAVSYVVPNFLGHNNYMDWDQLEQVRDSGLVEIGAHTMDHMWLKGADPVKLKYEVEESRKTLEDRLHISVTAFAYPYGAFDLAAMQEAKDAGFTTAVTTVAGKEESDEDRYFIYRLRPGYRTGEELINYLSLDSYK